jgi:hypothetical protein
MKAFIATALLAGFAAAASATEYTNFEIPPASTGAVAPAQLVPSLVGGEATEFAVPAGSGEFMRINAFALTNWSIDLYA